MSAAGLRSADDILRCVSDESIDALFGKEPAHVPPRPAEEVARGIVSCSGMVRFDGLVTAIESPDDAGIAREIVARLVAVARAEGAAAALAGQQPRDLAGRIRELIQEYAGRWADTSGEEAAAFREVMKHLRVALKAAKAGDDLSVYVENLREDDDYSKAYLDIFRSAADELEAIVRECEEAKR